MKIVPVVGLCACALAIGYAAGSWRHPAIVTVAQLPPPEPSVIIPEPATAPAAESVAKPDSSELTFWKSEAEKLKKTADEVFRLRGDVSRLNAELADSRQKYAQLQQASLSLQAPAQQTQPLPSSKDKGPQPERRTLALAETPPAIQEAVGREFGAGEVRSVVAQSTQAPDGKIQYGMKGQFADGRHFALNLAEDGAVLAKNEQIPANTLPAEVSSAVQQNFGELNVGDVSHVTEGDRQYYRLTAKTAQQGMEIAVRSDGTILSYSARYREPNEKPKQVLK